MLIKTCCGNLASLYTHSAASAVLLLAALTGCGGPASESATPAAVSDEQTEAAGPAAPEPAVTAPAPNAEPSAEPPADASEATSPAAGSAMKLPPADALDADDSASQDDSAGNKGGIELPPELAPKTDAAEESSSNPVDPKANDAAATATIEAQLADWKQIESHAKSTGKITVMDLWSTACPPCLEEFPGLVRLSESMPEQVACVSVSVDYDGRKTKPPESYSKSVNAFLGAMNADFTNFLCQTPSDEVFATMDLPSIPAVLIFDADGKLVKRFVDAGETIGFGYEKDIVPFVKTLTN